MNEIIIFDGAYAINDFGNCIMHVQILLVIIMIYVREFLFYLLNLALLMSVLQGSSQGCSQRDLGGLVRENVEGQERFPVSAGFELTTLIHEIYNMYCNFVINHPLPLILLPNKSLVKTLSNVCFMACSSVPHSQVLLRSTI